MLKTLNLNRKDGRVEQVNLTLSPGECLGISGPSGGGKTLLLRALSLLDPSQGEIWLMGKKSQDWEIPLYRKTLLYVAQKPVFLDTVVQACLNHPLQFKTHQNSVLEPVRWGDLGLDNDFEKKQIRHLSGGEQQKLALIRAIRLKPHILLLDEPTAAMDPQSTLRAEAYILEWLNSDPQRACIWVSHHNEQLERVSTRRLVFTEHTLHPFEQETPDVTSL